ncbi:Fis family transcriptional regulator [Enterovibrio sp. 27052020O]|uniref:Fis family transcriptional regulator n=1 Tax=Enterovibrio sp. 27052020O TaxID=3241166 RepID=UPI0038910D96
MRKTDKKTDKQIREMLTNVCNTALQELAGFQWLTHLVDYSNFPKSLKVICVFDTNSSLNEFEQSNHFQRFNALIQSSLIRAGINLDVRSISYDTEENCSRDNNGRWTDRL